MEDFSVVWTIGGIPCSPCMSGMLFCETSRERGHHGLARHVLFPVIFR